MADIDGNGSIAGTVHDNAPFFSIVIPTFNRADVIQHTIESCLAQHFSDFEVLVVDDGSTDATEAAVKTVGDDRVIYLQQRNAGPAAARNRGVEAARGQYIAFLDSDDLFLPEKLQVFYRRIQETGADVYYGPMLVDRGVGRFWVRPERGVQAHDDVFDYLFLRRGVFLVSTIVVNALVARKHPFLETLWYGDNDQFVVEIQLRGGSLEYIARPLSIYADQDDAARLSQSPVFNDDAAVHEAFFAWVESHRAAMSDRAYYAYRARFRSRITARTAPLQAVGDLVTAYRADALSGRACLRQSVQTFLPKFYRYCADAVARSRGQRQQESK